MTSKISEAAFEESIQASLIEHGGYIVASPENFSRELSLDKSSVFAFLQETQPKQWERLKSIHGSEINNKLIQRLVKELDNRGTLDVLRKGITDYGVSFQMAYFQPNTSLNPETERLYDLNRITITRQVKYSLKNENSIDMLISINGLPVATLELKNQFTGQDTSNARKQYAFDRDPKELLFQFKKRALVHFAVDTDRVYMTTRLEGRVTKYLPFNKGDNNGAGNPINPNGYKTAYLWEEVLTKDSLMEIVGRFVHLQSEEYVVDGKTYKKESVIFPRYHQLDSVRKLATDAKKNGAGKNYLIQHSAGSGKSNSIAWLAYRLSSLHDDNDQRVFDSIVVITDRKVLDQQLQNTIFQFEHKQGVVKKIDESSDQLAVALQSGTNIIITTLQKFPYVLEKIGTLPARKYALIVDEAHSSQGGEAAKKLKQVLTAKDLDEAEKLDILDDIDAEDELVRSMAARGKHKNLSFFAFTATPKAKTLEVFGQKDDEGKPRPFHLYSMRQAIEEGFIMDVLQNYVTYKTYFRLSQDLKKDPNVNKKQAAKAIGKSVSLHPHNLAQKTKIMVDHFRQITMPKIGGKAKAMVVTGSRLHVVRYKQEFDRYIRENGYHEIKALIAFSGTVNDNGLDYTEPQMNGFGEKELPKKFDTDEYKILLVADKYQTGFDQPLLHTMFIDKKIAGVKAVQTLSRLNRTCPGKEDTFILDFVNTDEDIIKAFQPYYTQTTLETTTDPNHLYDLKNKLEQSNIIWQSEVDNFCKVFFKSPDMQTKKDHALLNSFIDPAVERYKGINIPDTQEGRERQEDFKHALSVFLRLYAFLAQIMPFQDPNLEKLYAYGRLLLTKLPKKDSQERFKLTDDVALEYYRIQKIKERSIALDPTKEGELSPLTDAGTKDNADEKAKLSEIIRIINDKFGTDFTEADKLFFDQVEADMIANDKLAKQAKANTLDNFQHGFNDVFIDVLVGRMEQNQEIFNKIMDNEDFRKVVANWMLKKVYTKLNNEKI